MLRLATIPPSLTPAERHAVDTLVDLTFLLRTEMDEAVLLRVVEGEGTSLSPSALEARSWTITRAPGEVRIDRSLFRTMADVVGLQAEYASPERDRFDRVPASAAPLVSARSEHRPLFGIVANAVRQAVLDVAERRPIRLLSPWPDGRRWAAALSHDIDVVEKWPVFTALRLGELAKKREWTGALRVAGAAAGAVLRKPTLDGVREVLRIERASGVRSTWFALCGTPTLRSMRAGDLTYHPESRATRRILSEVVAPGHEIGLHGSFATMMDSGLLSAQRDRLERLVGRRVAGVRQHYLRMEPGRTHRAMHDAGFVFDSTCGFADRNGFRLGVADVVEAWDPDRGQSAGIAEVPFVWMDRALSKYRRIEEPARWVEDGLRLAESCREVNGLWVGIWHPNLTPSLGFPGAVDAYETLVRSLADRGPHFAPIGELVEWRRARSSARADRLRPDGTVALASAPAAALSLEDAIGRVVQRFTAA